MQKILGEMQTILCEQGKRQFSVAKDSAGRAISSERNQMG
jgi:hypothetical protein